MELRNRTIDWWRRRRLTPPRIDDIRWYRSNADLPDNLPRHQLAIIGDQNAPKWAILECPCGRGHVIQVDLSARHQPYWQLELDRGRPSLFPSIDYEDSSRRCHYWLRVGRVRWSRDSRLRRRLALRRT